MSVGIYKITNQLNGKIYIGQSCQIERRWKEHKKIAFSKNSTKYNYPLYLAIRKYGLENFLFEIIELIEYTDKSIKDLLNEREVFWIKFYDSYKNGYNQTVGGDGCLKLDYEEIKQVYQEKQNLRETAKAINCSVDAVKDALISLNIPIRDSSSIVRELQGNKVSQFTKDGVYLRSFDTQRDAAKFLVENGFAKGTSNSCGGIASHIGQVISGKRKTAYGFIWKNKDE